MVTLPSRTSAAGGRKIEPLRPLKGADSADSARAVE